jgi:GST-like protein
MWQMGGLGPMLGQAHHFLHYNPGISEYAEQRYAKEAARLYGVLNTRLSGRDYLAGAGQGAYTIADMAIWPWVSRFQWQQIELKAYPQVYEWYTRIAARPAVQSGYQIPHYSTQIPKPE